MSKSILIKFKKLELVSDYQLPIKISIEAGGKNYQLSSFRTLRNGLVNLYGETIQLPISTKQFTIVISHNYTRSKLVQFPVPQSTVAQFTKNLNIFTFEAKKSKLTIEAYIAIENSQGNQHLLQKSLSQASFSDFKIRPVNLNRVIKNQKQKKENEAENQIKKNSLKLRITDTASEPDLIHHKSKSFLNQGNYSPLFQAKYALNSDDSLSSFELGYNKNKGRKNKREHIKTQNDYKKLAHQKNIRRQVKSLQLNNQSFQLDYPVPLPKITPYTTQVRIHSKGEIPQQEHPQNPQKTLRRHKSSSIFDIFSNRYYITVGVIGSISGVVGGLLQ